MNQSKNLVTALAIMIPIILVIATFVDRAIREENKSKSFINRKFRYTALELICYALYLLIFALIGFSFVWLAFAGNNWFLIVLTLIGGFLMSVNLILLLNHVVHEIFQTVTVDYSNKTISVRKYGKLIRIKLDDPHTYQIRYVPKWTKNYGKGFKFFGANFSKTVIKNGGTRIQLSSFRNKQFRFSSYIPSKNIKLVRRQINFII